MVENNDTYCDRWQRSFAAIYASLEVPRVSRRAVGILLATHTLLLAYSAYVHSPTFNEPGHLAAGLSNWRFGRFEMYCVNPPLVKMVATIPLVFTSHNEDWTGYHIRHGIRLEMPMGERLVAANGERSMFLFMIARWACIPFSWLGALVCYMWARDLFGHPSGVLACAMWCFDPNILAHASLITPDAHATALGVAACYTFWRWLKQPSWIQAVLAGVLLGLAELAKTTLILFYPIWPLMWVVYRWRDRHDMAARDWVREAGMTVVRLFVGLYVLNLGYGFEGTLKPLREYRFVSSLFTGQSTNGTTVMGATPRERSTMARKVLTEQSTNRFANSWLGQLYVPFPKSYVLGIDIQQRDFESYGRPSYLCGEWRAKGWWYYYLFAYAVKTPIGILALGLLTVGMRTLCLRKDICMWRAKLLGRPSQTSEEFQKVGFRVQEVKSSLRDEFVLLFPAATVFVVVSSKTGFSEHFRYVLPCFPFTIIWISQIGVLLAGKISARSQFTNINTHRAENARHADNFASAFYLMRLGSTGLVSIFICWTVVSSLWIFPHSISYFNESVGGPLNGHKYLLGSSLDWGQDLRYLDCWMQQSLSEIWRRNVHVAYWGGINPKDIGIDLYSRWPSDAVANNDEERFDPKDGKSVLPKGYYIISANLLAGLTESVRDGGSQNAHVSEEALNYFRQKEPYATIGYSITVYFVK